MTDDHTHHDRTQHDAAHDHPHPAIDRLHTEFAAAQHGIAHIDTVQDDAHRDRIVAAIRTDLPDVASRSAYEAGGDAVLAEIRRFQRLEFADDVRRAVARSSEDLWRAIVADATEAVRASR